jgi:hypothetical protein
MTRNAGATRQEARYSARCRAADRYLDRAALRGPSCLQRHRHDGGAAMHWDIRASARQHGRDPLRHVIPPWCRP